MRISTCCHTLHDGLCVDRLCLQEPENEPILKNLCQHKRSRGGWLSACAVVVLGSGLGNTGVFASAILITLWKLDAHTSQAKNYILSAALSHACVEQVFRAAYMADGPTGIWGRGYSLFVKPFSWPTTFKTTCSEYVPSIS